MTELLPSTKLTIPDFVNLLYPYAKDTQDTTGISAIAILSQAALESGWNSSSPGWAYFGVKWNEFVGGDRQLLTTTEYLKTSDVEFPEIISITPVVRNGQKYFKYIVKDYFRKYESPEECFTDHANYFLRNPRYSDALNVKEDTYAFFDAIALAGYATDPNYSQSLASIAHRIEQFIPTS